MKQVLLISILIVALSCNRVSRKDRAASDSLTVKSKYFLQHKMLDSAAILIATAINLDPTNYLAYNNRAILNVRQHSAPEKVIADFNKALKLCPDYDITLYSLANYYFEIDDYKNVVKYSNILLALPKLEEIDSCNIQHIFSIKGEAERYLFDDANAFNDLETAIRLDQNDADAHRNLGDYYFDPQHKIVKAINEYSIAIKLDSNYAKAYLGRANCLENLSPPFINDATSDYKKAFKIEPTILNLYYTKSLLFDRIKREVLLSQRVEAKHEQ